MGYIILVLLILSGVSLLFVLIVRLLEGLDNLRQSIETAQATVVAKRGWTIGTFHVTFQFEDGTRQEARIRGRAYGLLAVGDMGTLTFQGTRYKGFHRREG